MATAYHRDQSGAPALVYSTSVGGIAQFTALKTILKACLVTGYGSQPAAGWELTAEGSNYLVLRNGSHSGYICLTWLSGGVVRVYVAETFTGMSGDVMTGAGRKSGVAAGETLPQSLAARLLAHSSDSSSWAMVADERTFVISIMGETGNIEVTTVGFRGFTLYAGEDTGGNFLSIGGLNSLQTSVNGAVGYFSSRRGFTVLKNPATGVLVGSGALEVLAPLVFRDNSSLQFTPIAKMSEARLAEIVWVGGSVEAGALRGLASAVDLLLAASVSQGAQWLGRSTPLNIRDLNTSIDLGEGHQYFPGCANDASFFLLTNNPAFW